MVVARLPTEGPAHDARLETRWAAAVLAATILWRLPSFFDPPWVNDEGTYFAVAQAMAHGYRLYAGVWENKPPLVYLLYEAVYQPFGASLVTVRILAALAVLSMVLLVMRISARLANARAASAAGLLAGLLMGVPFLEGTTANSEVFLTFFTALGVWLALRGWRFPAGLFMGVAVLFKAVAGFDATALFIVLCMRGRVQLGSADHGRRRDWAPYAAGVMAPLAIACLGANLTGILRAMLQDALLYPLGYVGHANGSGVPWLVLVKILVLIVLTVWLVRKPFPALWLVWAATGALVSGRFFGHYTLQAVPPLCVLLAVWLNTRSGTWHRRTVVFLPVAFLSLALACAAVGWVMVRTGDDSILARRLQWYVNVARLASGAESYATYRDQVDDHVTRNLEVSRRLQRLPPGKLLVWGNAPWVYVLSDRLPATKYTSSLRTPEVPGETQALRASVERGKPAVIVVIRPPLPPLGAAFHALPARYRRVTRVDDASVLAARARRTRRPTR